MLYLKGQLSKSAWMMGAIDKETVPLVGDLRTINSLGFQTTQGQPGKPECREVVYGKKSKEYFNNVQREYVEGLFPRALSDQFIQQLTAHKLFVLRKQYAPPSFKETENKISADPKVWPQQRDLDDFQDIVLTKWQGHESKDLVTSQPWTNYTNLRQWTITKPSESIETLEIDCQPKLVTWIKVNMVELFICAPEFCKDGMLEIIISILKELQPQMAKLPEMEIIT